MLYRMGCQSAVSKYIVLNGNFVFNLHDFHLRTIFQEHNLGVSRDLLVFSIFKFKIIFHL